MARKRCEDCGRYECDSAPVYDPCLEDPENEDVDKPFCLMFWEFCPEDGMCMKEDEDGASAEEDAGA